MNRIIPKLAVLSLLAVAIVVAPARMLAQDQKGPGTTEKKHASKNNKGIPFHGKVKALDKTLKTISVGERVFQITSETKIKKDGKPATMDDAVVGDDIGGTYTRSADGKLTAKTLRLGPKSEGKSKGAGKKEKKSE